MPRRWLDPQIRTGIAIAALILSITGLVLAGHKSQRSIWPAPQDDPLVIATDPSPTGSPGTTVHGTSTTFSGTGADGRMAVSHGRLLASGTRAFFTEVRIGASDLPGFAYHRQPISFVLTIDTSGSMAGQKIVDARNAALRLVDRMHDDDQIAVVRFASDAEVVVPLQPVRQARHSAREQISRMRAVGNTDIAGALRLSSTTLRWRHGDSVRRIVLVTDGRDTSGAPRYTASTVARQMADNGVTVSSLGIGADYDDAYLADLADAGRGNYEFLASTSALERFLEKELQETTRTTIREAHAHLDLPAGVRVRDVWGANWRRDGSGVQLSFGALHAGDERRALVTLEADVGAPGSWFAIGGSVRWLPAGNQAVAVQLPPIRVEAAATAEQVDNARDYSVLAAVASVRASQREREAARAFEQGKRETALRLNQQSVAELERAAESAPAGEASRLRAQKRAYSQDRTIYQTAKPSPAPARAIGAREHKNLDRDQAY